jgi:hypothetical protein
MLPPLLIGDQSAAIIQRWNADWNEALASFSALSD